MNSEKLGSDLTVYSLADGSKVYIEDTGEVSFASAPGLTLGKGTIAIAIAGVRACRQAMRLHREAGFAGDFFCCARTDDGGAEHRRKFFARFFKEMEVRS